MINIKSLFTDDEVARIKEIRLRDIILTVTHMKDEDIQANPFKAPEPGGKINTSSKINGA